MATKIQLVGMIQSTKEGILVSRVFFDEVLRSVSQSVGYLTSTVQQLKEAQANPNLIIQGNQETLNRLIQIAVDQLTNIKLTIEKEILPGEASTIRSWLHSISLLKECFTRQRLFAADSDYTPITILEIQDSLQLLITALQQIIQFTQQAREKAHEIFSFQLHTPHILFPDPHVFSSLEVKTNELICTILSKHSMIILDQPDQVLMKGIPPAQHTSQRHADENTTTRTSLSICLLNLGNFFGSDLFTQVKLCLIDSVQAEQICGWEYGNAMPNIVPVGRLCLRGEPLLDNVNVTHVEATLTMFPDENMKKGLIPGVCVTDVSRDRKRSNVAQEKLFLLATTSTWPCFNTAQGHTFAYPVWTLSVPLIVRSNASQSVEAWATISWDNYFGVFGRTSFTHIGNGVMKFASWDVLKDVVKDHFNNWLEPAGTTPNRSLDAENLEYIKEKMRTLTSFQDENNICLKTFFNANHHSFWSWFYKSTSILNQNYFKNAWNNQHIHGFMSEEKARWMLNTLDRNTSAGTFIVKFSETSQNSFTIVFAQINEFGRFGVHKSSVTLADKKNEETGIKNFLTHIYLSNVNSRNSDGNCCTRAFSCIYPNISIENANVFPLSDYQDIIANRNATGYVGKTITLQL